MKYISKIDKDFMPILLEMNEFKKTANSKIEIMIEDGDGYNFSYNFVASCDRERSYKIIERLVKSLLWIVGGYKIYIKGADDIALRIKNDYNSVRTFDRDFMSDIYQKNFEVVAVNELPQLKMRNILVGGHTNGCRIGFDAGGSDRKVSAVVDGKVVFSEEVVWFPKINSDLQYHYDAIVSAFKSAAAHMPRVDAIGVSSAGIHINNRTQVASLFLKIPKENKEKTKDIYIRAGKEIGENVPIVVANDGDITAIAGAMIYKSGNILGISMGTSEAGGYVNENKGLNGWLSELAFVPCDCNKNAHLDEWSGDIGTGVNYFSQDAVINLAKMAGIDFENDLSPALKLEYVQDLMKKGEEKAAEIYRTIGIYLGYTIPFYAEFYNIKYVLLLGRVLTGLGGDKIKQTATMILNDEFSSYNIKIVTADEEFKRNGQSIAAASLPIVK
ncbi:MAG: ROK family protein [Clostridia bacterium]